ncbi:MAG: hypothetical protein UR34_C0012G0006 [candidate division WS6 bacterium GW2011_GWC1_33_20]|uniref:Fibronectin type-III domain-containing protein n=1 Tax=candidate division WS6 bacterium GW2011_GWC1_33_20 TaxID=1619089 RepID=A0A0F9ZHP9_9BACT|nr:MAG: hypothetical protein UR34_C0012G0006 [candidate division WS6 bacterium GW2011_GWC1_33_20]HBB64821.1 hypothetical protein [Patescibacteria group bacterium]
MKLRNAPRKKKSGKSLLLTFLLLFSLPVFVFGLLQDKSFDWRNLAFDDIKVSEENPCIITFPNVNPYSLEINKSVRIQVDALSEILGIKSVNIQDSIGTTLLTKTYDDNPKKITESFLFTPMVAKAYNLTGSITDAGEQTFECVISSPYDVQGVRAIASNSKPIFTTLPKSSIPSQNIQTGITYEYTIVAEDSDKDTINYAYSFTPGATWLKTTVIEDGGNGKLTIKLKGSTNNPGSYLANIFIHDGYSKHLSSQSWVISVSPKGNDIPTVSVINPVESVQITTEKTLKIEWDAIDSNGIKRYEIYISSNPANQNSWTPIDKNISPSTTSYNINLESITDGTYRIIVRAIDNQTPEAIGMGISPEIIISRVKEDEKPDDQVILPEPQVINISPTSKDEIRNTTPTIKASLVAPVGETIQESSIKVVLDSKDITTSIKINKISESEYTVIYTPDSALSEGVHKVELSFKDSNNTEKETDWIFTISEDETIADKDNFNIFGYKLAKRTAYIIGGGLGLILLAIFIPIIIVAMWKDQPKDSNEINPSLPPTIPSTQEIPIVEETPKIKELVTEKFQAPEPALEPTKEDNSNIPEPEDDLSLLCKQIEDLKQEEDKQNNVTKQ